MSYVNVICAVMLSGISLAALTVIYNVITFWSHYEKAQARNCRDNYCY